MDQPKRKNNRLQGYDYNSGGGYFITICTQDRKPTLSNIVGDDDLGVPENRLTEWGKILRKYIQTADKIERITVDKYVIMPNHVHIMVFVDMLEDGTPRSSSPTMAVIPRFVAALKRYVNREIGQNIFQRSYHDHVIRGQQDYLKIWEYMENNPKQWELDCFFIEEN